MKRRAALIAGILLCAIGVTGCLESRGLSAAQVRHVEDTALRLTKVARAGISRGEIAGDGPDHDGLLEPAGETGSSFFGIETAWTVTRARCTIGRHAYLLAGADIARDARSDARSVEAMRSRAEEALVALNGRDVVGIAQSGSLVRFGGKSTMALPLRCRGLFPAGTLVVRRKP
jgi:hypothetical protein